MLTTATVSKLLSVGLWEISSGFLCAIHFERIGEQHVIHFISKSYKDWAPNLPRSRLHFNISEIFARGLTQQQNGNHYRKWAFNNIQRERDGVSCS